MPDKIRTQGTQGTQGTQAPSLTLAGGRRPSVAPGPVFPTHGRGVLAGAEPEALVALVRHLAAQRELGPREGAISRGLGDPAGHS